MSILLVKTPDDVSSQGFRKSYFWGTISGVEKYKCFLMYPEVLREPLICEKFDRPNSCVENWTCNCRRFWKCTCNSPNPEEAKTAEINSFPAWSVASTIGVLRPRSGIEPISGEKRDKVSATMLSLPLMCSTS
jgi:hypothetical protein